MRTTIDINEELLRAAKSRAARDQRTLKATIEQALREFLGGPANLARHGPPIPVFRGQGVHPDVDLTNNAAMEDRMNAESWRQRAASVGAGG